MEFKSVIYRKAEQKDIDTIAEIILLASRRLGQAGVDQWQRGYPNRGSVERDVEAEVGRVLVNEVGEIVAYGALIYTGEPAYDDLSGGEWLSDGDYAVIHRLCVAEKFVGQGCSREFMLSAEREAKAKVPAMRIDTHPENLIMQSLVGSLGYSYCGDVVIESRRLAYEKLLG